jgi:hypothetical protein
MLFMVIEHFKTHAAKAIYQRARAQGRMLPEGLRIVHWQDLADFEIVHVVSSAEAADAALSDHDLPHID